MPEISRVTEITPEIVAAFQRLIPQLNPKIPPPSLDDLVSIVKSPATILLIARAPDRDEEIVGSLTLAFYRIPTGLKVWIEDVVVDEKIRGQGIGKALTQAALQYAIEEGAKSVDLTSRPSREAANRLYQRIGFQKRETNVYRYFF